MIALLAAAAMFPLATSAHAQSSPTALVWAPPEDFRQWSKVDLLLRSKSDLKLTIALTPAMVTPLVKAALNPWAAAGRVEFAARIPGDPVLPLTAAHPSAPRPDDALERAASALASVEKRLAVGPVGLVCGAGALDASLIGPLAAAGSPWVLVGPYAVSSGPWAAEGRTTFVPARTPGPAPEELAAPGALAVDESDLTDTHLLSDLTDLPRRIGPPLGWVTISGLLKIQGSARAPAAEISSWPGWDGVVAGPPSDPSARAAWDAYGETAKAVELYKNSGLADIKVLESATGLLRKAQEARFYRPMGAEASGLPADLRARLRAVYAKIKAPAPEALFEAGISTTQAAAAERPTNVHAASGPNWIFFENPAASLARAPAGASDVAPWRVRGLRVEWDPSQILLRILLARVDAAPTPPRPIFDVYIDLNRVVGAGSTRLLEGRGAYAAARDAWEFAVTSAGTDGRLWRAARSPEPEELSPLSVETDPARGEVKIVVPRSILRGNPARWGYTLLALAEDPERAGQKPPATFVGPDGTIILGALAPLDVQKAVADKPGVPQRLPAVRLEP